MGARSSRNRYYEKTWCNRMRLYRITGEEYHDNDPTLDFSKWSRAHAKKTAQKFDAQFDHPAETYEQYRIVRIVGGKYEVRRELI